MEGHGDNTVGWYKRMFEALAQVKGVTLHDLFDCPYELIEAPELDSNTTIQKWESSYYRSLTKLNKAEPKVASMVDHDGTTLSPRDIPSNLWENYVVTVSLNNCFLSRSIAMFPDDFGRCSWILGNCPGVLSHLLRVLHKYGEQPVDVTSVNFGGESDVTAIEVELTCSRTKMTYPMTFFIERLILYRLSREHCQVDVSFSGMPSNSVEYGCALADYAASYIQIAHARLSKWKPDVTEVETAA